MSGYRPLLSKVDRPFDLLNLKSNHQKSFSKKLEIWPDKNYANIHSGVKTFDNRNREKLMTEVSEESGDPSN